MKTIELGIQPKWNCVVFGSLQWSDNPDEMSEEMVDVRLPNGILVSAGWSDADSRYVVTVTLNGRLLNNVSCAKTPEVAKDRIIERVDGFRGRSLNVSDTDDNETTCVVSRDPHVQVRVA